MAWLKYMYQPSIQPPNGRSYFSISPGCCFWSSLRSDHTLTFLRIDALGGIVVLRDGGSRVSKHRARVARRCLPACGRPSSRRRSRRTRDRPCRNRNAHFRQVPRDDDGDTFGAAGLGVDFPFAALADQGVRVGRADRRRRRPRNWWGRRTLSRTCPSPRPRPRCGAAFRLVPSPTVCPANRS